MTMPHSPGWYDDPDDSGALRYFNGQDWTPQRKRKPSTPSRPPQPDPYTPVPPAGPADPYAPGYSYPAGPADPYASGYPYPAGPPDPYASGYPYPAGPPDPYASGYPYPAGPPDPYGAVPSIAPAGPYGPIDPYGPAIPGSNGPVPPQQLPLSRLIAGTAVGVDRIIGLVIAGCGIALIVASFSVWGRATVSLHSSDGTFGLVTALFPGVGKPSMVGNFSNGSFGGKMTVDPPPTLHNTHPGWITLALGVIAVIAGIAYLWLRQRGILAIVVAVLAAVAGVVCVAHVFDVGGTFNDPADLAGANLSPGAGLVSACVLSFALAAVSISAYIIEWRAQYRKAPY
jgi:Protein of unknown function (DUF2510)